MFLVEIKKSLPALLMHSETLLPLALRCGCEPVQSPSWKVKVPFSYIHFQYVGDS